MAVSDAVIHTFRKAAEVLDGLGVRYAVFGGIAANMWERIRVTRDADFLVSAESVDVAQLKEAMRNAGFAHLDEANHVRLEDLGILRFWYPAGPMGFSIKTDVALGSSEFHQQVLDRRILVRAFGREYPVASVEDCILLKLVAARAIDLADAADLMLIHKGQVDLAYLHQWAQNLGVTGPLTDMIDRP